MLIIMINGALTVEVAQNLHIGAKRIFQLGGFNLRKFIMNHRPLQNRIDSEASQLGRDEALSGAHDIDMYTRNTPSANKTNDQLCSKTRVAPLQEVTIPKLELLSAVLLARLGEFSYGNTSL